MIIKPQEGKKVRFVKEYNRNSTAVRRQNIAVQTFSFLTESWFMKTAKVNRV